MENVKGLLSAKVNGEKVFNWILRDLGDPSSVYKNLNSPKYRVYSLTSKADFDLYGNPVYSSSADYLIESEKYGVPQKRHRVILLGVREDIENVPKTLGIRKDEVPLKKIIGDLPKLRSGLNRTFISSKLVDGKKKRFYRVESDSDLRWKEFIESFSKEMVSWNGFMNGEFTGTISIPKESIGAEFVKCKTPHKKNPLYDWFRDGKLKGASNHISRPHLTQDLKRYFFSSWFASFYGRSPKLKEFEKYEEMLLPDHKNAKSGKFADRFRVQLPGEPATTITSHISKDGHYFIHYDPNQCRSLTVREAARIQTFPDNYLFCGSRTQQFQQVGNAVPPFLAYQIAEIVLDIFKEGKILQKSSKFR
jgi:DNA (cytosine-5)-methyltransferase 1